MIASPVQPKVWKKPPKQCILALNCSADSGGPGLPPPKHAEVRRSITVAARKVLPVEQLRATANRLSDIAIKTVGDEYVRQLRLAAKEPLQAVMRLQHALLSFPTTSEGLKLPSTGSVLLADVGGTVETVGELMPGWKPTAEQCKDDTPFVTRVLRRRMTLYHPDCWLLLASRTKSHTLRVSLGSSGLTLDVSVKPSATTELIYCCQPEARIRVVSPRGHFTGEDPRKGLPAEPPGPNGKPSPSRLLARAGTVEDVREDGVPLILFDGDYIAIPLDLRSPLVVAEENPPVLRQAELGIPPSPEQQAAAAVLQRQFSDTMAPRFSKEKEQDRAASIIGRSCRKSQARKKGKQSAKSAQEEAAAATIQRIHRKHMAPRLEQQKEARSPIGFIRQLSIRIEGWVKDATHE